MTEAQDRCALLVRRFRREPDASARSLLVTIFGDSVAPRGGEVWLGTLSRLVEPLGINDRLVRTSLQRLVTDGLVGNRRDGRLSFYSIAPAARNEFREADRRIYHPRTATPWDGRWTVAVESPGLPTGERTALRQQLAWLGFGSLNPPVHVCPLDRTEELQQLLADLGLADHVAVFRGEVAPGGRSTKDLARALTGGLRELEPAWKAFLRRFGPLADSLAALDEGTPPDMDPEDAFLTRTLLVHAYRRVVLREPELPAELWPTGWIGEQAYAVAATCYASLAEPADAHVQRVCAVAGLEAAPVDPAYAGRFAAARALLT
ncbi:PaaX family transcriptional regulator [Sporichthya polymorpha]|uniref:PaaX family transcriptional regulator n=1 Tax=Sporichthya polymorpha TaxID=35751 RepID=UPI00035DD148|nr:PaaX family transcriptional regulator C-terminal domain-containing protein [Sporichthya polymorpha]